MTSFLFLVLPALQAEKPGLLLEARDADRSVVLAVPTPNFTLREDESLHP